MTDRKRLVLADPRTIHAEIRRLYFATGPRTIQADLTRAIELLKSLPGEEEREKARVYMDGLMQMRGEWGQTSGTSGKSGRSGRSK